MKATRKMKASFALTPPGVQGIKEFCETETDSTVITESIKMLTQIFPEKVIMLCRTKHADARYISENCIDLWGVSANEIMSASAADFLKLVHPDDIEPLFKGNERMAEYMSVDDPAEIRYVLSYRMKSSDGQYVPTRDERMIVKTDNNSYAYFCIYSRFEEKLAPGSVAVEVYKVTKDRKVKINSHVIQSAKNGFSSRELDIMKLIDLGLSNVEMAEKLSLSIFTIKNHKQRLFRKVNARNSIELLRYARTARLV